MDLEKTVSSKTDGYYHKLCLIGAKEVGKTSLACSIQNNYFSKKYIPTRDIHKYEVPHNFNSNNKDVEDKYATIEINDR